MNCEDKKLKFNDVEVDSLNNIKEISQYNYNYYTYKNHILLGISDDDNETEWFLIHNTTRFDLIGYSYTSESPEKIIVSESRHT